MNKKMILVMSLLLPIKISSSEFRLDHKYYKLRNKALIYLDGIPNGLDGKAIAEILAVRKNIEEDKLGILDSNHARKGKYKFGGELYSISDLVIQERKIRANNNQAQIAELNECLKQARHNFISFTKPFMDKLKDAKRFLIELIKESCDLRNIDKKNTILMEWANINGSEEVLLDTKIENFEKFDSFLTQVFGFLGDLLQSCDKAREQYKKMNPNATHKK